MVGREAEEEVPNARKKNGTWGSRGTGTVNLFYAVEGGRIQRVFTRE